MWEPPASDLAQVDRYGSLQPVVSHRRSSRDGARNSEQAYHGTLLRDYRLFIFPSGSELCKIVKVPESSDNSRNLKRFSFLWACFQVIVKKGRDVVCIEGRGVE